MTARPIIFRAAMIRALLAGEKTQTRRIAKVTDKGCKPGFVTPMAGFTPRRPADHVAYCPYGQPGDLLWVKETFQPILTPYFDPPDSEWATGKGYQVLYMATDKAVVYVDRDDNVTERRKPSIHMPRWASRLTLRITDVRVQRLQDISEADARAEGITEEAVEAELHCAEAMNQKEPRPAAARFGVIWASIYGAESWSANPWVWALSFEVLRQNVDTVAA